jgi:hypothetical protein
MASAADVWRIVCVHPGMQALRCTALHYAALCGRTLLCDEAAYSESVALSLVEALLDADAPVNAVDKVTAAKRAAKGRHSNLMWQSHVLTDGCVF